MGAPIKHRKKFISHKKRWDKETIVSEGSLVGSYCLKNKKEIRRAEFMVSRFKKIAKSFNTSDEMKNSAESKNFLDKLKSKGFLSQEATTLDEVLDVTVRDILERRLANIVYKNKLARSPSQARQFVVHRHVRVGGKVVDSPSFSVPLALEPTVEFRNESTLASEEHPERKLAEEGIVEEIESEVEMVEEKKIEDQVDESGKSKSDIEEEKLDDEDNGEVKIEE